MAPFRALALNVANWSGATAAKLASGLANAASKNDVQRAEAWGRERSFIHVCNATLD